MSSGVFEAPASRSAKEGCNHGRVVHFLNKWWLLLLVPMKRPQWGVHQGRGHTTGTTCSHLHLLLSLSIAVTVDFVFICGGSSILDVHVEAGHGGSDGVTGRVRLRFVVRLAWYQARTQREELRRALILLRS